jgi:hypothetical protein
MSDSAASWRTLDRIPPQNRQECLAQNLKKAIPLEENCTLTDLLLRIDQADVKIR